MVVWHRFYPCPKGPARLLRASLRTLDLAEPVLQHTVQINGVRLLVCTSCLSFSTNSVIGITTCLFPAPRERTATLPASASRCPTTAMYGTLCVSASRIL